MIEQSKKTVNGLNICEYPCLLSTPGIGPVYATSILFEIGSIKAFPNHDALTKYAGIVWIENQSGILNPKIQG
ncbi:hypothetical protein bsdcttw_45280 [Anaerocolumna chitinilytica]|uniref:Transposase IS116/IS110/IS902 C-terminal domain-containing protein n=1 Tax=Anaerocolumna chitinilytica TaxID=1727145 RepID=A0A7M3SA70_9FIRM|nr:hypothetical protein bsdcttw_45280 [Anaerocolumna chitinilytica]